MTKLCLRIFFAAGDESDAALGIHGDVAFDVAAGLRPAVTKLGIRFVAAAADEGDVALGVDVDIAVDIAVRIDSTMAELRVSIIVAAADEGDVATCRDTDSPAEVALVKNAAVTDLRVGTFVVAADGRNIVLKFRGDGPAHSFTARGDVAQLGKGVVGVVAPSQDQIEAGDVGGAAAAAHGDAFRAVVGADEYAALVVAVAPRPPENLPKVEGAANAGDARRARRLGDAVPTGHQADRAGAGVLHAGVGKDVPMGQQGQ